MTLGIGYFIPRWFTCLYTVTHSSTSHTTATWLGVEPTTLQSQVQHPNHYTTKPAGSNNRKLCHLLESIVLFTVNTFSITISSIQHNQLVLQRLKVSLINRARRHVIICSTFKQVNTQLVIETPISELCSITCLLDHLTSEYTQQPCLSPSQTGCHSNCLPWSDELT